MTRAWNKAKIWGPTEIEPMSSRTPGGRSIHWATRTHEERGQYSLQKAVIHIAFPHFRFSVLQSCWWPPLRSLPSTSSPPQGWQGYSSRSHGSVCISCHLVIIIIIIIVNWLMRSQDETLKNLYSIEYRPILGRVSTDVSTDISTDVSVKTPHKIHDP